MKINDYLLELDVTVWNQLHPFPGTYCMLTGPPILLRHHMDGDEYGSAHKSLPGLPILHPTHHPLPISWYLHILHT